MMSTDASGGLYLLQLHSVIDRVFAKLWFHLLCSLKALHKSSEPSELSKQLQFSPFKHEFHYFQFLAYAESPSYLCCEPFATFSVTALSSVGRASWPARRDDDLFVSFILALLMDCLINADSSTTMSRPQWRSTDARAMTTNSAH
jgi:hypothetical protein